MPSDTLSHLFRDNYLISLLRGKRSQLLDRQQLVSLSETKSQTEIIGVLSEGSYGPELSKLTPESTPIETERAIRQGFARAVMSIINAAQGDTRDFLAEYRRRFDAYDLAGLIGFKAQGKTWEEYLATRQPLALMKEAELHRLYSLDDLTAIAYSGGDRHLVERMKGFSMEDAAAEKASLLRDTINGWGEERFYKYIEEKLSGTDRESCEPIVGSSIDIANLLVILRSKGLGTAGIRDHLIPTHWKLNQRTIDQLLASPDVSQALDAISSHDYYQKILAGARQKFEESKSLAFIEVALRVHQLKLSTRLFLGSPYSVGIVLAFLVLKENEAKNLAAVLTGVGAGIGGEELRSLIAVQN